MNATDDSVLRLDHVRKTYTLRRGVLERFRSGRKQVHAVDSVTLSCRPGEILGLVGESGCGKSTLGRIMVGLIPPSDGEVYWRGRPLHSLSGDAWREYRMGAQMVFQDTHSSLNPRKRIRTILNEALAARGIERRDRPDRTATLLRQVGIDQALLGRFPHELSGGQRQRIGIARALAMEPSLLVADEPVSSLDVSLQGQIINLLRELNRSLALTIVLISHDLAVVARVCDRVAVAYGGRIVESGPPERVLRNPAHPYTRALLDAVPRGLGRRQRVILPAETGDVATGCRFRGRCVNATGVCAELVPELRGVGMDHEAACHFAEPGVDRNETTTRSSALA
jgi:oligopeptide/dipeptide ABC transporter ATP-binding protein